MNYNPTDSFEAYGMPNFVKDIETLYSLAEEASVNSTTIMVEVGSWSGRSALTMLSGSGGLAKIHCFDLWFMQQECYLPTHECGIPILEGFCRNVGDELFRSVFPHPGRSEFWAKYWTQPLDLVYLDGDHSYISVKQDIECWLPHVRRGGIIAGHDYRWHGVKRAVDESLPGHESVVEDGTDPNRHMFSDPDNWGGVWWRKCP